ncbi:16S rRNA (cytosine(967)-C(5))-methyltransferase RsmB [Paucibacter sp. APW11]|uniref:16S rRNA (cytosine(967)-C(5))-methyltransferase n=1 Tax=Roseateles aquae TaxID=3077235 RepID=A0ABU3PAK9_9BURK|nr:16S rRNA (cytosine(967)-C(5))-methyltransferase RsmB [Paucibacter sp. APW11]MDT8999560.1 16S rRNA (cytosine(967)-C(5))-methyltransferase RsmB [Paucibacter sp. APW11]
MSSPKPPISHPAPPLQRLLLQTADAVQAVRAGQSLTELLARCPTPLRPATQSLSFHVLRHLGAAEALRRLLVPKAPPPKVDNLLICALALLWPQAEPPYADHTVVDQAVEAARQRAKNSAAFVNAVLRRFLREREALVAAVEKDATARYNHPAWWIAQLQRDWPERWQAMLAVNNTRPPMTLRVHARQPLAAYQARLAEAGIAAQPFGALAPQALLLERAVPVTELPGFAAGDVSVQDAAAQLAAPLTVGELRTWTQQDLTPATELLLPALPSGARVLDACSAPGGKTAHLLELGDYDLLALDADAERLSRVQQNLDRLQQRARLKAADGRDTASWWDGQRFDAILLDAPCSASGIVRRHPDVRWLRRATDIAALAETQAQLLDALWPLLKPGGRLVYATCSVFKAEGEDQIDAFLQRQPGAKRLHVSATTGHLLPLTDNGQTQPVASLDGFFYALLLKP